MFKWFFILSAIYFVIAGDGLAALFCIGAMCISDLEKRVEELEKRVCSTLDAARK